MEDTIREKALILKCVKLLSSQTKAACYDILYQIEKVINTLDTVNSKQVKSLLYEWEHPRSSKLADGTFISLIDYTHTLRVYVKVDPNRHFDMMTNRYYFTTKYDKEFQEFTKKNIVEAFKHTSQEIPIVSYLKRHRLRKQNSKTFRFAILEMLEEIEFNTVFTINNTIKMNSRLKK